MALIPNDIREPARQNAEFWGAGSVAAGLGVAAATIVGAATGPFVVFGAVAAAVAWRERRISNDPPDRNFHRDAVPRPFRLVFEHYPRDPASIALSDVTIRLDRAYGDLGAMLRAFERAQGAAEAGAEQFVHRRLTETLTWARSSASALADVADAAERAAPVLDPLLEDAPTGPMNVRLEDFDEAVLAFAYVARVPVEALDRAFRAQRLRIPHDGAGSIGATVRPTRDLATRLAMWQPRLTGSDR